MGLATLVAVEGPSYAGKSSLVRELAQQLPSDGTIVIECYVAVAPDRASVPTSLPVSADAQLEAQRFYLDLELERFRRAVNEKPSAGMILLDRSIHTLLAHAHAIQRMTGFAVYDRFLAIVRETPGIAWPDIVFYLDAEQRVLDARYPAVGDPRERLVTDPQFNAGFRSYFLSRNVERSPQVVVLDATRATAVLGADVIRSLEARGHAQAAGKTDPSGGASS